MKEALECFIVALRLGLTSFGGPVAHVGYFREEYVSRRGWLKEERFGELMALSQFIPGPGSSQLGAAIGYERAGFLGGFAAWLGFTLPSAIVMILVALGVDQFPSGAIHGMKLAAIAVVALAWLGMRKSLANSWRKGAIALFSLGVLYFFGAAWVTILVIACAGILGALFLPLDGSPLQEDADVKKRRGGGVIALVFFFLLLFLSYRTDLSRDWEAMAGIYHAGALVFGGGHVVLPMLQEAMVPSFMKQEIFLGGYGATQAVPGPVFTFAGFLGGKVNAFGNPWLGGAAGIVAVFLPGMLLLAGTLALWGRLRSKEWAQKAIQGANAAVVGVLGLALIQMSSSGAILGWRDALGLGILFVILERKLLPTWAVVLLAAGVGYV